jgi:acyl-CoA thioesterase II
MPSWIADLVRLEGAGPAFRSSTTFGGGPRLYGGLIAAQALAAAGRTVGPDRLPQSLHAYFIKGGQVGVDVEYLVETTRDGRSFDTRRVTASQVGVPIFEMLASFHVPEITVDFQRPGPPLLPFDEATTEVQPPDPWPDFFEARVATRENPPEWPLQPFWFRSRGPVEDDPLLQACAVTFLSDLGLVSAARPPGHDEPGPGGAASLDHALWLHRRIDPTRWHCYDAVGVSHSDARGLAFGSIRDRDGRLVASVAQESLWRV